MHSHFKKILYFDILEKGGKAKEEEEEEEADSSKQKVVELSPATAFVRLLLSEGMDRRVERRINGTDSTLGMEKYKTETDLPRQEVVPVVQSFKHQLSE
jgi:hypothetical protein